MINFYIRESLENHIPINIIYMSNDKITQRTIKVLRIEKDTIMAYCYLRKAKRLFKLENILGAEYANMSIVKH
jgi:predicted DNA-binding transcriptional regulator YafY